MKNGKSQDISIKKLVAGVTLLKPVHIAQFYCEVFAEGLFESYINPILVKMIHYDVLTGVNHEFVGYFESSRIFVFKFG